MDAYPYTAGSSTLVTLLPADALDGGETELLRRLGMTEERARLAQTLEEYVPFALEDVRLATVPGRPESLPFPQSHNHLMTQSPS